MGLFKKRNKARNVQDATEEGAQADDAVRDQAKTFSEGIYKALKDGDREEFIRCLDITEQQGRDAFQKMLYKRGPVGETLLLICYLFTRGDLAKILIERAEKLGFLDIVFQTYNEPGEDLPPVLYSNPLKRDWVSEGLYTGEAALHIAIVNRSLEDSRFLVEKMVACRGTQYTKLFVKYAAVTGAFFRQDGSVYFGESMYAFAACRKIKALVNLIKDHGGDPNLQDVYGNTALHLMVIKSLPDMYDYILDHHGGNPSIRNKDGCTPLTLAARLGNTVMFDHILMRSKQVIWIFGPVICNAYSLAQIDTFRVVHKKKRTRRSIEAWASASTSDLLGKDAPHPNGSSHTETDDAAPAPVLARQKSFGSNPSSRYVTNLPRTTESDRMYGDGVLVPRVVEEDCPPMCETGLSALEEIVLYGSYELLHHRLIKSLLSTKWSTFASQVFISEMCVYILFLLCFSYATVTRPSVANGLTSRDDESIYDEVYDKRWEYTDPGSYVRLAAEVTVIFFTLLWTFFEVYRYFKQTTSHIKIQQDRLGKAFAISRMTFIACLYVGMVARVARASDVEDYLLALAGVLGWSYLLFYFRGFKLTGKFVMMIYKMLVNDIRRFSVIFLVFVFGFGIATHAVLANDVQSSFLHRALVLYVLMLGEVHDLLEFEDARLQAMSVFVFAGYIMIVSVLLLNLLIAMLSDTWAKEKERAQSEFLMERARIILQVETRLDKQGMDKFRCGEELAADDPSRYMIVEEMLEEDEPEDRSPPSSPGSTARHHHDDVRSIVASTVHGSAKSARSSVMPLSARTASTEHLLPAPPLDIASLKTRRRSCMVVDSVRSNMDELDDVMSYEKLSQSRRGSRIHSPMMSPKVAPSPEPLSVVTPKLPTSPEPLSILTVMDAASPR